MHGPIHPIPVLLLFEFFVTRCLFLQMHLLKSCVVTSIVDEFLVLNSCDNKQLKQHEVRESLYCYDVTVHTIHFCSAELTASCSLLQMKDVCTLQRGTFARKSLPSEVYKTPRAPWWRMRIKQDQAGKITFDSFRPKLLETKTVCYLFARRFSSRTWRASNTVTFA